MQSPRAREGEITLTCNLTGPTMHHKIGSLIQVGIYAVSTSVTRHMPGHYVQYIVPHKRLGAQWLYQAASNNRCCGVTASAWGRSRSHKSLDRTDIALRYRVTYAEEGICCRYNPNPDSHWDSTYQIETYEWYMARNVLPYRQRESPLWNRGARMHSQVTWQNLH